MPDDFTHMPDNAEALAEARETYLLELFYNAARNGVVEVRSNVIGSPTEESINQAIALEQALIVHWQRSRSYGTVWKKWGALSPLLSAAKKMDRLMECFWFRRDGHSVPGKPDIDDAVDLINYAAFFMRLQAGEGQ